MMLHDDEAELYDAAHELLRMSTLATAGGAPRLGRQLLEQAAGLLEERARQNGELVH